MQFLGSILGFVAGVVVLIKLFQKDGFLMDLIGLITCNIYTFIWGWMNADSAGIKTVMLVWTLAILGGMIFGVAGGALEGISGARTY